MTGFTYPETWQLAEEDGTVIGWYDTEWDAKKAQAAELDKDIRPLVITRLGS